MTFRSPLFEEHRRLGARLIEFAGWEMPLKYRGVIAEHLAVRERVGLFDVSHLGKLVVEGPGAAGLLDRLLPGKVAALGEWSAGYNLLLTEDGGIVDDLFVYRRPEMFVVVPNAANTAAVLEVIASEAGGGVSVTDARDRWAIIALQGPRAREAGGPVLPGAGGLRLHRFADAEAGGMPVQVARTGYTGEFGFELFVAAEDAPRLWRKLLDAGEPLGILPAGLGARDTLRLEMGYPLHGHDISPATNPLEASLSWVVDWAKPEFRGKPALEQVRRDGVRRRLVGLLAGAPGIPREGHAILRDGDRVGEVTSGNHSPVLGRGIAMGYVDTDHAAPGTMLAVDVRGKRLPVEVTKPPFVKRTGG